MRAGVRLTGVLVMLLASGCSPAASGTPPMADSLFVETLVHLHLADARVFEAEGIPPQAAAPSASVPASAVRDSVLASLGVDSTAYMETVAYYAAHPDDFVVRYNEVLERLNALDL